MNKQRVAAVKDFAWEYVLPERTGQLRKADIERIGIEHDMNLTEEEATILWLMKRSFEGNIDALSLLIDYANGTAVLE